MLILAATPIGNLGDASKRLHSALAEAEHIAAEDTRSLKQLASGLGIRLNARLYSLHEHNEADRILQLIEIAKTQNLLLVSDAGMPTISDPGFQLVRAAADAGVEVIMLPGPSAVLSALAVSGLPTDSFCFEGFLPRKQGERIRAFEALARERRTMIFFEAPHRILASLQNAATVFGPERLASVSRELTKKFEHTERGTLAQLVDWAQTSPRGEMVLVIAGAGERVVDMESLVTDATQLAAAGLGLKQAVARVAFEAGVSKSALYDLALKRKA